MIFSFFNDSLKNLRATLAFWIVNVYYAKYLTEKAASHTEVIVATSPVIQALSQKDRHFRTASGCFERLWSIIRRSAVRNKVSLFMLPALVRRGIPLWDGMKLYSKHYPHFIFMTEDREGKSNFGSMLMNLLPWWLWGSQGVLCSGD